MQAMSGVPLASMRAQLPEPRAQVPSSMGACTRSPAWGHAFAEQRTVPAVAVGAGGGLGAARWWRAVRRWLESLPPPTNPRPSTIAAAAAAAAPASPTAVDAPAL